MARQPIGRPKFFERFPQLSLENLLLLTFHWACQSSVQELLGDVSLSMKTIWEYFEALQEICSHDLSQSKLGGTVETGAVKLGEYVVLGALDRKSQCSRLGLLTLEQASRTSRHLQLLDEWLKSPCKLLSEKALPGWKKVVSKAANPRHVLTYLCRTMGDLFADLRHDQLTFQSLQGFLDELQWRHKYGQHPEAAFWSIFNQLDNLSEKPMTTKAKLGDLHTNSSVSNIRKKMIHWEPIGAAYRSQLENMTEARSIRTARQEIRDYFDEIIKKAKHGSAASPDEEVDEAAAKSFELCKKNIKKLHSSLLALLSDVRAIPILTGGTTEVNAENLMEIKIVFDNDPVAIEKMDLEADALEQQLQEEMYDRFPIKWLLEKGLLKNEGLCYVCRSKAILQERNCYRDGYAWQCTNYVCQFSNEFKRPAFFNRCGYTLSNILYLVFHWAVQSDVKTVQASTKLYAFKIRFLWKTLQERCSLSLIEKMELMGGKNGLVEVSIMSYGNFFILGALERGTGLTRMQVFPVDVKLDLQMLKDHLESWLRPNASIILNSTKYRKFSACYYVFQADQRITDNTSPDYHTLNITEYMAKHILNMFGKFHVESVTMELLQTYLDEVMWRHRYGKSPKLAFWNIMKLITASNPKSFPMLIRCPPISEKSNNTEMRPEGLLMSEICFVCQKKKIPLYNLPRDPDKIKNWISILQEQGDINRPSSLPSINYIIKHGRVCTTHLISFENDGKLEESSDPSKVKVVHSKYVASGISKPKYPGSMQVPVTKSRKGKAQKSKVHKGKGNAPKKADSKSLMPEYQPVVLISRLSPSTLAAYSSSSTSSVTPSEPSTASPVKINENISTLTLNACDYVKQKPLPSSPEKIQFQEKFECVECKTFADSEHFARKFTCEDCKNCTFSTYCSKAFFEHRGALLFGKRMPKKREVEHIRQPVVLEDIFSCFCGEDFMDGNKLASHLVKCRKESCKLSKPLTKESLKKEVKTPSLKTYRKKKGRKK